MVKLVEWLPSLYQLLGLILQHCINSVWWYRPTMLTLKCGKEDKKVKVIFTA